VQCGVVDPILLARDERIKTPVTFEAAKALRIRILIERDVEHIDRCFQGVIYEEAGLGVEFGVLVSFERACDGPMVPAAEKQHIHILTIMNIVVLQLVDH